MSKTKVNFGNYQKKFRAPHIPQKHYFFVQVIGIDNILEMLTVEALLEFFCLGT